MKEAKNSLIQIVDDVPENIQVLGKVLSRHGYRVAVSTSGMDALDALKDIMPDLILLDVMMPGMDGIEVCRRIKQNERTRHIPVLFISAQSETALKLNGFEAGGADYIGKPFDAVEVLARVKTHLNLKQAMETIQTHNDQLEQLVEARTKELIQAERRAAFSLFSQGVVHNLKNPLTAIIGGSQYLQFQKDRLSKEIMDELHPDIKDYLENVRKYIRIFNSAANKLNEMIQSLMIKFRTDNSQVLENVKLNNLIQTELKFLEADARFKNKTKKEIALSADQLYIKAIPGELNQIIENIVQNALDAMDEQDNPCLTFESGRDDRMVWLSIADNGPGMDGPTQAKIFDAFFTTKASSSKSVNGSIGTGLGLFMCKQIIEKYKGRLEVDSVVGEGTQFKIVLPSVN